MTSIVETSSCRPLFLCIEEKRAIAVALALFVAIAGSVTIGVALAGYAPHSYVYLGTAGLAVDLVLSAVLLALPALHQKNTIKAEPPSMLFEVEESSEDPDQISVESIENSESLPVVKTHSVYQVMGLPDELWLKIFKELSPHDLGQILFTFKDWYQLAQHHSLWFQWIVEEDWREASPEPYQTWLVLNSLKRNLNPQLEEKAPAFSTVVSEWTTTCSGNHLLHLCASDVAVWKYEKGQVVRQCERDFSQFNCLFWGFAIYDNIAYLGTDQGSIILWDIINNTTEIWRGAHNTDWICSVCVNKDKIITTSEQVIKIWDKKSHMLLNTIDNKSQSYRGNKILVYKCNLITYNKKELNLINIETSEKKVIAPDVIGKKIKRVVLGNSVLLVQVKDKFQETSSIQRYDLERNQWLSQLNLEKGYKLVCALGGQITVLCKGKHYMWDYRQTL